MILYLDTSALIKLYADEAGALLVRAAKSQADLNATSLVTYAEARSALARKMRLGDISRSEFIRHKANLDRDWMDFERIPLNEATVMRAGQLAEMHRLRGFDAIHLACAEVLQNALREITFACFDAELSRAPSACGMTLLAAA